MADGCIEVSITRENWRRMSEEQRTDHIFDVLQYLVENAKRSRLRDSFFALAGGVIGALIAWLPITVANVKGLIP